MDDLQIYSQLIHKTERKLVKKLKNGNGIQQIAPLLVQLRKRNRKMQIDIKYMKDSTSAIKDELDRLNLHLQNKYYEQRHLKSQIIECNEFPIVHDKLDLISQEEFAQLTDLTGKSAHEIMLARLRDELTKREEAEEENKRLVQRRADLVAENKKKKEDLEDLDTKLKAFISSAMPIKQVFTSNYV